MRKSADMGCNLKYGGSPESSSITVQPTDQMSDAVVKPDIWNREAHEIIRTHRHDSDTRSRKYGVARETALANASNNLTQSGSAPWKRVDSPG